MTQRNLTRIFLGIIMVGYLGVAGLFAVQVPDWQTPDEPAHYNYIRQIAEEGIIPRIELGDWDQEYLDALRATHFPPQLLDDLDSIQYEDHQPPLYYLLAAPIFLLTGGSLTALRLFSVVIGAIIPLCAYGIGWLMFPKRPWLGLAAAAFVAFQPQHIHILASVNNDSLGWAMIAITLFATVAYLKRIPLRYIDVQPWHLGILVGIGIITKTTTYFMAGVVPLAIFLHYRRRYLLDVEEMTDYTFPEETDDTHIQWNALLRSWAKFLIPVLFFALLWWGRNLHTYGFPDFLGLKAHDAVVIGQPRTAELIDRVGFGDYVMQLKEVSFNSFWGQFGWMGVPMQARFYVVILLGLILAGVGLLIDVFYLRPRDEKVMSLNQRDVWIVHLSVITLSILAFLYYNTEFQQFQGRYMFSMMIPLGLLLALGADAWRRFLIEEIYPRFGKRIKPLPSEIVIWGRAEWLTVLVFLPQALLDLWLLWRVIVPNLR